MAGVTTVLAGTHAHPHARAVLGPALAPGGEPSHAYLFYGPSGAGKRNVARAVAADLLSEGSPAPASARARVASGAHPDLTWVTPSGAHELLVSDIAEPVVGAASRTPFESARRVFVIERADTLNDESANRLLKTLEEPAFFVHLILLTDRLSEVIGTIVSRCQLVRFDASPPQELAERLERAAGGAVTSETALACARLALGDGEQAATLAIGDGIALRAAGERFARAALAGRVSSDRPWTELLAVCKARGDAARADVEAALAQALEFAARSEKRRVQTEFEERMRRADRRARTAALDLGLQVVSLWFRDLACLGWDAPDVVHNVDRMVELRADLAVDDAPRDPQHLRAAVELVEDTRSRFQLNVTEELACQALAYRLEELVGPRA